MLKELFEENELKLPPLTVGDDLLDWIEESQEKLDFRLVDTHPLPPNIIEHFQNSAGTLPEDMLWFYNHFTPWIGMNDSYAKWEEHLAIAFKQLRKAATLRGVNEKEIQSRIEKTPVLLPVNLSQKATAFAFADHYGRIAIIDGNIGLTLGRPIAVGLLNYFIAQVVVEIVWCDEGYKTYAQAMMDPHVIEAGRWPTINPPQHIFIEAFEKDFWDILQE